MAKIQCLILAIDIINTFLFCVQGLICSEPAFFMFSTLMIVGCIIDFYNMKWSSNHLYKCNGPLMFATRIELMILFLIMLWSLLSITLHIFNLV